MGYVKHYGERLDHVKLLTAGPLATHLDDQSILWCNENLTDGFVPDAQVRRMVDWTGVFAQGDGDRKPKPVDAIALAETLVAVGRWDRETGGFRIHDYLDVQQSAEQILEKRRKDSARKQGRKAQRNLASVPNGIRTESNA